MTVYIAIDGDGGSGKTYLSNLLGKKLKSPVLHLDDFGDDSHPFIGIPAMIKAVQALNEETVIIEGIGVFDERFDFLEPYRIYVDTPKDVRAKRARNRDQPTDNRSADDWKVIYKIWENEASGYIKKAPFRADLIVKDSDKRVADFIVEQVTNFLKHAQ